VRAVSVHRDALVVTSRMWQTTATAVRAGGEAILVDAPYFPDELDALPALLAQTGFEPNGLLATHGDFDHLLGRLAFPDASIGVAETTAARMRAEPGVAQRLLREVDEQDDVERPRPLSLGNVQSLPVPGRLEIGDGELELIPADGHTQDGMAVWAPFADVLCVGDYLSPVEIPWISEHGSRDSYLATLARLERYVERASWVVPGHGAPLDPQRALAILREDVAYLERLPDPQTPLPLARRGTAQRKIHAENLERVL
jgi:glyoxylase-like metal-dependent hydrolase (beta-lactamase superfamily II)